MGLEDRQYYQDDERIWRSGFGESQMGPVRLSAIGWTIAICVGLVLLDAFTPLVPNSEFHVLSDWLALKTDQLWRVWAFITHGYAHASIDSSIGLMHVGSNMLALFFLGRPIEMRLGSREFVKFYLLAILFSVAVLIAVKAIVGQPASVVGASGAVTAVVMLFVFYYPKQKIYLFGVIGLPAWVLGVIMVGWDLSRSLDPQSHVAWEAHLGGATFALLYYSLKLNFGWLEFSSKQFKRRPKLKVHDPVDHRSEKLKRQADEILAKIAEHGESSLTSKERRMLSRYSKQLRQDRE